MDFDGGRDDILTLGESLGYVYGTVGLRIYLWDRGAEMSDHRYIKNTVVSTGKLQNAKPRLTKSRDNG